MRKPPEQLFGRLLDSLTDIFALVLDRDQRIVYANAAFLEHFAVSWEEVAGRSCFDLVSPFSSRQPAEGGFCPTELGPFYPARTHLSREAHGKKYVYETTFYRLLNGEEAPWTVCVFRDVTERFVLESQIRKLDELERKLVQASIDGIVVNDMEGNVLIFNEGAAKILGYTPEEAIGRVTADVFYPPGIAHEIKDKIYAPDYGGVGILENYETMARRQDGTLVPIWLSARLLQENEQEVGIVGYFRDLRERKRLEEEVLRNERLAVLGKAVARITHEIKNPLMLIGGFAQQCAREQGISLEGQRKLQLIREEVLRLEKFLGELGTFTRITPTQKTPGDLLALVREVAESLEDVFKAQQVVFEIQNPGQIPRFFFDPGQIRQVLVNLFKNSLEAMPKGGRLTLGLEVQGESLEIRVTDTGPGISPEHLQVLFTPFFSTKAGGTGLGLTICRQLIEQHGGEIKIDSEVGRGTTCLIGLPLNARPGAPG